MKYKIYTDGESFYLKLKSGWSWHWETRGAGVDVYYYVVKRKFESEAAVVSYVVMHYGTSCERVRELRVV